LNCLSFACRHNSLNIIKYLVEERKMDIHHTNRSETTYLMEASLGNNCTTIIKYLIEECNIDPTILNKKGFDCLAYACMRNTSISIIKYLIEEYKMNINRVYENGLDCLALACRKNSSVNVIDYLVDDQKMNIHNVTKDGRNYLELACKENTVTVVKHLINKYNIRFSTDKLCYECFFAACANNSHLDVIKYLHKTYNLNLEYKNDRGKTCLTSAYANPESRVIGKYFIEETNADIYSICEDYWNELVPVISNNCNRLNELIKYGLDNEYNTDIIKQVNPLFLNSEISSIITGFYPSTDNPYSYKFDKFKNEVNQLSCVLPMETKPSTLRSSCVVWVETVAKDPLFEHNDICYYGNRTMVFNSIILLKEIKDCADFNETIILSGKAPKYFIDMWINAAYTNYFNINEIKINDLEQCLRHIDQYPMTNLSIDLLESDLIEYFENNILHLDEFINNIMNKYQMKSMYLYFHNKKYKNIHK
jgi:hypothetical protein